jgi:hypothetical protein
MNDISIPEISNEEEKSQDSFLASLLGFQKELN